MRHLYSALLSTTFLLYAGCFQFYNPVDPDSPVYGGEQTERIDSNLPLPPDNLEAVLTVTGEVILTWSDNSDNETGFVIERRYGDEDFAELARTSKNTTEYTDSPTGSGNYSYRVLSFNEHGKSGPSGEITVSTGSFTESPSVQEHFRRRLLITADNTGFPENFTDFPVLVQLSSSNITPSALGTEPGKIRFYSEDLSQSYPFEVEQWDPGGMTIVWVRVPSIPASSSTERFWCYFEYDSAETLAPAAGNVWSDQFLGVWHLNESGGPPYIDSAPGGIDGNLNGNSQLFTQPAPVAGRIGGGQQWINTTDGIAIPPISGSDLGPFTISLWMKIDDLAASDNGRIIDKGWSSQWGVHARIVTNDIQYEMASDTHNIADARVLTLNDFVIQGDWAWWCFRYDLPFTGATGDERDNFKDGASMFGGTGGNPYGNSMYDGDSGAYLHIGNSNYDNTLSIRGIIDEVRVSSVIRSAAWIQAQYASMTDSYLIYGPEEILP